MGTEPSIRLYNNWKPRPTTWVLKRTYPADTSIPEKRTDRSLSRQHGRWACTSIHRVSSPAQHVSGPGQGRDPVPSGRYPGRSACSRYVDDLEVRSGGHPLRRSQGRRGLRPQAAFDEGTRGVNQAVCLRDIDNHKSRRRHPSARHEHQRPDHGLDHGHLQYAQRLFGAGGGDRQAVQRRRDAGKGGCDGAGMHEHGPGDGGSSIHADGRGEGGGAGVRERGVGGGEDAAGPGMQDSNCDKRRLGRGPQRIRDWTFGRCSPKRRRSPICGTQSTGTG